MGRGLGKLQQDILDTLKHNNRPLFAKELAWVLHNEGKEERDYSDPSASYESAVRRAIYSLGKRRLVEYTRGSMAYGIDDIHGLACWLTGSESPNRSLYKVIPISGKDAEQAILEVFKNPHRLGHVEYSSVINDAKKILEKRLGVSYYADGNRMGMALNRAVKRLVEKGLIKAYWRNSNGRYAWIVSVSKLEQI